MMVGNLLISTLGVTGRERQYPCFRLSKVIALVATLADGGGEAIGMMKIKVPSFSI